MPSPASAHPPAAQLAALRARLGRGAPLPVAQAAVQLAGRYPQSALPWGVLAMALTAAGQGAEAASAWAQARQRLVPGDRDAWLLVARDALAVQAHDVADGLLTGLCNAELAAGGARDLELWLSLSRLRRARGLAVAARPVAQKAVEAHPEAPAAWMELAEVHADSADVRGCRDAVHAALARIDAGPPGPAAAAQRVGCARLLLAAGYADEAAVLLGRVDPETPRHAATLGLVHERRGDAPAALAALDPWVAAGKASAVELGVWARLLRRGPRAGEALATLRGALGRFPDPPLQRMLLHRIGELAEALGEPAAAFAAHDAANRTGRLPWSVDHFDRECAAIVALADQPLPPPPPGPLPGAGIVLVAGLPRSGTSLLEQILTAHPAVRGIGESPALRRTLAALPGDPAQPWPLRLAACSAADRAAAGARYRAAVDAEAGSAGIRVDKTPPNLLHIDALARILPGARAVLIRRDPRDAALSCYFQNFGPFYAWTDALPWLGHVARTYDTLRDRWLARPPLPVLDLAYEDLARDPAPTIRRVLDFLGLPWDPAVLAFHRSGREMRTASYDQVREPINTRSIGRSAAYAAWLGPLEAALAGAPTAAG